MQGRNGANTLTLSLDIDLLRSFVVIAEVRALSRAAARVGRTQSALSQQMKRL
ncbi:LysR family transcriptional regulator, partial [Burkholderia cenocepacia]